MTPEELRQILQQPEDEKLEFKVRLPRPEHLASIVAAFANTRGGTLVIGADERSPEKGGISQARVAEANAREWIGSHIRPVPDYATEVVSLEPGRDYLVINVDPGRLAPYIADGRLLERRGSRDLPITAERIARSVAATSGDSAAGVQRLAERIASMAIVIERLEGQLHWRRQLPLQIALLILGAVIGYILGIWNPLG